MARWEDLQWAIPMVLNLGLSGQPFSGPDLGGFSKDPTEELFIRWFELGAYMPFCRGHGEQGTCRKEPWSFGPRALDAVRSALERRMRLLPTFVALFEEAHRSGLPVCRPLFFAEPTNERLRTQDDAFLLGPDLLVAPIVQEGTVSRTVTLPNGGWFHFPGGESVLGQEAKLDAPIGTTPVLARAGSIVFEGPTRLHTSEPDTHRVWHVFLNEQGNAAGQFYDDVASGRMVSITAERTSDGVRVEVSGPPPEIERSREIRIHGLAAMLQHTDETETSITVAS